MKVTRIKFQRGDDSPESFSEDYKQFIDSEIEQTQKPESPDVKAMQLEVLRRMKLQEGEVAPKNLEDDLANIQARGRALFDLKTKLMIAFLNHLENDFEGPDQFACTSHYEVSLLSQDYESYSMTPEDNSTNLAVSTQIEEPEGDEEASCKIVLMAGQEVLAETSDALEAAKCAAQFLNK